MGGRCRFYIMVFIFASSVLAVVIRLLCNLHFDNAFLLRAQVVEHKMDGAFVVALRLGNAPYCFSQQ